MLKRVFVSSVTTGLGRQRASVAAALRRADVHVSDQDTTFRLGGGTLLQKLYVEIWRVDACIFLIGDLAGKRPEPEHEEHYVELATFRRFRECTGLNSASYTQWEFMFAWERKIPCFSFFVTSANGRADEEQLAFKKWLKTIGVDREPYTTLRTLENDVVLTLVDRARPPPLPARPGGDHAAVTLPGARPMSGEDRHLFSGREQEIWTVGATLREHGFAAIIGGSGAGKTSLMQAGVLPGWTIPGRGGVPCHTIRPGADPFLALARPFAEADVGADELAEELRGDPTLFGSVHKRHCQAKGLHSVLVAIEQFEELFTQPDLVVRDFMRLIVASLRGAKPGAERDGAPPPMFALTVRADFFHRCLEHPDFLVFLQRGIVLLGEPSRAVVGEIVRSIAGRIDLDLPEELVDQLVSDTDALTSGRLVMLGYMLRALYRDRHRRYSAATLKLYNQLGGIKGSIAQSADRAFDSFDAPPERKEAARQLLFAGLVQVDTNGQPLRRQAHRSIFAGDRNVDRLIELFAAPDVALLNLSSDFVEITHEILFERYTAYKDWIDDNREELVLAANAEKAAREWDALRRDADFLWPAKKIEDATRKLAGSPAVAALLSPIACAFLDPRRTLEAIAQELARADTDLPRRLEIGQTLAARGGGDARPGVATFDDGAPTILWLPVDANRRIRVRIDEDYWTPKSVEAFLIGAYPVTCAQFRAFASDATYAADDWWGSVERARRGKPDFRLPGNAPAAPVTWHHAMAFARWADVRLRGAHWPDVPEAWHVRLPTEWEWLQAATAGRDRTYPWGDDHASERARSPADHAQGGAVIPVGLFPAGASPWGVNDMVGNALEWSLNQFATSSEGDHVGRPLRGGPLAQRHANACAFRKKLSQSSATPLDSGFRLVVAPGDPAALARLGLKD